MNRPKLNEIAMPSPLCDKNMIAASMYPGQQDYLLKRVYDYGGVLFEMEIINGEERIVRAYQKPITTES